MAQDEKITYIAALRNTDARPGGQFDLKSLKTMLSNCVAVGQEWQNDIRAVLFVKMKTDPGLTDELRERIRKNTRTNASPRHVPVKIMNVPDIPYTLNMKKVELAVQKVIHGREAKNKDALRNPQAVDFWADIAEIIN